MSHHFALVGYPLGHSFSRAYFTDKFQSEGIDAEYFNFEIPSIELLPNLVAASKQLRGFNVTIPYKQAIIPLLDTMSDAAREIGAVNVVKVQHTETTFRLHGYNTDCIGFTNSLKPHLIQGETYRALVLGTGGAARAVVYALRQMQIPTTLVSRNSFRHNFCADQLLYAELTPAVIAAHNLIVNCTPCGMFPTIDTAPPIPYDYISSSHILYDLVYNPMDTLFLQKGREKGAKTICGLDMLYRQAEASWDIWISNSRT